MEVDLKDNEKSILDMFSVSKQKSKEAVPVSARLSESDLIKLKKIKTAMGSANSSDAIRWCIKRAWAENENDIERLNEKNSEKLE